MDNTTKTDDEALHWPLFTYIALLFLFGLFGNGIILYIYHFQMQRTIFGFFVQILAMVDMTTVLVSLPGSFVFRLYTHDLDTSRMCKFLMFMNHFSVLTAGCLLSVIAIQRYRKLCHPHGNQITRSLAKKLCFGVVCMTFSLSVPIVFIVGVTDTPVRIDDNKTTIVPLCDYEAPLKGTGQSIIYAILVDGEFFGVTCVLTVVYSIIWKSLQKQRKSGHISGRAVTKVFFILTVVFIMSVLPLMIISTLFSFFPTPPTLTLTTQILFDFGVYLPYINSVINPVIYSFTSKIFRAKCLSVCRLNRKLKKQTSDDTDDTSASQSVTTSM